MNCIPIQAKRELNSLHMKQLASYINKVSTGSSLAIGTGYYQGRAC